MLETLDFTIRIGSTPTFSYFNLYLYFAATQHTTFINHTMMGQGIVACKGFNRMHGVVTRQFGNVYPIIMIIPRTEHVIHVLAFV